MTELAGLSFEFEPAESSAELAPWPVSPAAEPAELAAELAAPAPWLAAPAAAPSQDCRAAPPSPASPPAAACATARWPHSSGPAVAAAAPSSRSALRASPGSRPAPFAARYCSPCTPATADGTPLLAAAAPAYRPDFAAPPAPSRPARAPFLDPTASSPAPSSVPPAPSDSVSPPTARSARSRSRDGATQPDYEDPQACPRRANRLAAKRSRALGE